jgi:hypothetical protein
MTSGGESERLFEAYSIPSPDLKQVADRGHALTTDGRRRQVADFALGWLTRHGISATAPSESRLR